MVIHSELVKRTEESGWEPCLRVSKEGSDGVLLDKDYNPIIGQVWDIKRVLNFVVVSKDNIEDFM